MFVYSFHWYILRVCADCDFSVYHIHRPSIHIYHLQVGCILVAYHKDQQVDLSDLIKTAAMLCGEYKPIGVRQVMSDYVTSHNLMFCRMLSTSYELLSMWNISVTL